MTSPEVTAALRSFEAALHALQDRVEPGDLVSIEDSPNVVYAIWPDGRLAYTNLAFRAFAEANGAESLPVTWGLDRNVFHAMSGPVAAFYRKHWNTVRETGKPGEHSYECSSPEEFRLFHMHTYLLPGGLDLLLVVNSLALARPHDRAARAAIESRYRDEDGLIVQCTNCRRVRAVEAERAWHWVPAWVRRPPEQTSHGICSICMGAYYSPHFLRDEASPRPAQRNADR